MKLWIDDIRPAPEGWRWAKTSEEALHVFLSEDVEEVSFDHDLGGEDTAMEVVNELERNAFIYRSVNSFEWQIHSANPIGKRNLELALKSLERFWNGR